jgi:hypothetical protein
MLQRGLFSLERHARPIDSNDTKLRISFALAFNRRWQDARDVPSVQHDCCDESEHKRDVEGPRTSGRDGHIIHPPEAERCKRSNGGHNRHRQPVHLT